MEEEGKEESKKDNNKDNNIEQSLKKKTLMLLNPRLWITKFPRQIK